MSDLIHAITNPQTLLSIVVGVLVFFTLLTLLLSAITVAGGRVWLRNSETLVFAVGDAKGPEAKFAARLATVLKANSSRLRLKISPNPDNAKALAQFDRRDASLAILRTDAKVPPRARAIAILEHDVVLVLSPGGKKIKSLPELRKKKIAVVGDGENSVNFVRSALEISDSPDAAQRVQQAPPNTPFDKLFASGFAAVVAGGGVGVVGVFDLSVVFAAQGDGVGQVGFACAGVEELSVGSVDGFPGLGVVDFAPGEGAVAVGGGAGGVEQC